MSELESRPVIDEVESSAEYEDDSERNQKFGEEAIKLHEQLAGEEPIPEMAMIKRGRVENKAQARADLAHLKHLKTKLESGEAFTAEDLAFIYEKDRPIVRAESVDTTSAIVDLRGNVRKMLENGAKLEDVIGVMSLNEQALNIVALIDHGLNPDKAIAAFQMASTGFEVESDEQCDPELELIERGIIDVFNEYREEIDYLPAEFLIEHYDMLTDSSRENPFTPDEIIGAFTADEMIEHIDFIRKIKPDFNPEIILTSNVKEHFAPDQIPVLISFGIKPEKMIPYIDYEGITPEQLDMLLSDEESMKSFINRYYRGDTSSDLDLFEAVFDKIPDGKVEEYASMLSDEVYLSKYKYLQSRGIKMTPERGSKVVEMIPNMYANDELDLYLPAMDDLEELRQQGAIEDPDSKVSDLTRELLKSYSCPCLENIDIIVRHAGVIDSKKTIMDLLQNRYIYPDIVLRNSEKLKLYLGDPGFASYLLLLYSVGSRQHHPERLTFRGAEAEVLGGLIKTVNANGRVKELIDQGSIRPRAVAYNLETFFDSGVDVDINQLVGSLSNDPLTILDNYEALVKHGAEIDTKELIQKIKSQGLVDLETYDKMYACDPEAVDATAILAERIQHRVFCVIFEFSKWQKRGADLNKAIATGQYLDVYDDPINSDLKPSSVAGLLKLGIDPNLLASRIDRNRLLSREILSPLLHAGASIDFSWFLERIESETLRGETQDIDGQIILLATNMSDVTPLVKAIHDPATLERNKALLNACGANL